MKCYNHPKEDALAVCKICGKGVCDNCLITIANNSYCKACVEAGRIKVPTVEAPAPPVGVPMPTGVPSKTPFIVGASGATVSGFAGLLTMIFGGLLTTLIFGVYDYGGYYETIGIAGIISSIVLGIGLVLAGIGYLGMKRNYGAGTGTASFAFSIVVCVFMFLSAAFAIITLSSSPYYYRYYDNPWLAIYVILAIITLILFGVMQILWGAAHIVTRQYTGNSGLAMAAGIMLIISGALTLPVILAPVGIILFFIGEILAIIMFLISHIPEQRVQTR